MDYAAIIAAVVAGIGGVAATLLGVWLKFKLDARKLDRDECNLDDDRADKSYQVVIAEFRQRISALEGEVISIRKAWGDEVRDLQKEHQECIRNHERLVMKVEMLERRQRNE